MRLADHAPAKPAFFASVIPMALWMSRSRPKAMAIPSRSKASRFSEPPGESWKGMHLFPKQVFPRQADAERQDNRAGINYDHITAGIGGSAARLSFDLLVPSPDSLG